MAMSFKKAVFGGAILVASAFAGLTGVATAAGGSDYKMEHQHWHFNGPLGTYDRAAMQRGYQVYREVCAACHQLKHVSFRHLGDKGGPFEDKKYPNPNDNPLVKNFAADWLINDIDSDTGDTIERPGIPADKFPPIFANDAAARASNGGSLPPDLSLIVAARSNGADYLYNILTAYGKEVPSDMNLTAGLHYNPVMEGGAIAMAPPLSEDLIEYADGTPATVEQMAKDVTEFLAWTSDPKMENRKSLGLGVMIYLLILTALMFVSYKRVWRNVKH